MKKLTSFIFVIAIFLLQFSVLGVFLKFGQIPNLFVAFAVSLIVLFGFTRSLGWIIFSGFMLDIGSTWLIGSGMLVLIAVSWLVDELKIIAELRSRRYLFAILLSLLIAGASITFDFLLHFLIVFEKQIGISGLVDYNLLFNSDYAVKIIFSMVSGVIIYLLARKIKSGPVADILTKR